MENKTTLKDNTTLVSPPKTKEERIHDLNQEILYYTYMAERAQLQIDYLKERLNDSSRNNY